MSTTEDNRPGSSTGLHCYEAGCVEALALLRMTVVPSTYEDDWRNFMPALYEAAVFLGWRLFSSVWWCPTHVVAKSLACSRCLSPCPGCSCMGGPRADAVEGSPLCQ